MKDLEIIIDLKEKKIKFGSKEIEIKEPRSIGIYPFSISEFASSSGDISIVLRYFPEKEAGGDKKLIEYIKQLKEDFKMLFDNAPVYFSSASNGHEHEISFSLPREDYDIKIKNT